MSSKVNFTYKLNGNFEEGIDLFELTPAILSLGQIIRDSHEILYPEIPRIAIHIKPFKEGSFPIEIVTFAQSTLQETLNFMRSQNGQDVKEVLDFLGLVTKVTGFTGMSVLTLIFAMKGRAKKVEKVEPGQFKYTPIEGESVTVIEKVHNLYQDNRIQQNIYRGIGKSLEFPSVTSIESYLSDDKEKTTVNYNKNNVTDMKEYSIAEIPSHEEEQILENPIVAYIHPKRGSYEGEPNSWSFRRGDSDNDLIKVDISDESFLAKIKTGEYRPHWEDVILANLIEKQRKIGTKICRPTYQLVKVVEINKKPEQFKLDL